MKNLKDSNVFLKFVSEDGTDLFVPVSDLIDSGTPIDGDGDDLEQADSLVYRKDGKTFVAIRA